MGTPVSPIAFPDGAAVRPRLAARVADVPDAVVEQLAATGAAVTTAPAERAEASRDWWPLAVGWALSGEVAGLAAAVVRPTAAAQVPEILRRCHDAHVPVTPAGGRSGVCGASVPVHGGVVLDLTGLAGTVAVDAASGLAAVLPGTFGHDLEAELRSGHDATLGHWPQSVELSTVGGWLACRSAGQYSTRYGKVEDMVAGLDVALADGRTLTTGGSPRAATGPDLTQLFVGSEGTLGVITGARLRIHPAPPAERRAAYAFPRFADGLEACRRILRAGATPAVLRLYDEAETARHGYVGGDGTAAGLLVLDEGDEALVEATMAVVDRACRATGPAQPLGDEPVGHWLAHRNDVSALELFTRKGLVVDTMEVAAPWSVLPGVATAGREALAAAGALAATCHLSHSYRDGACLYFTFAAALDDPADPAERNTVYVDLWDAGARATLEAGANLSHHHGVGLNRARFLAGALGQGAFGVLGALKAALDPHGILNPGKLGLPSPFGVVPWP